MKRFEASQFTPTQWDTAAQKAKFANHFVRFVESGFARAKFPKWFYQRLSNCFGHIAHYDQAGFFSTFFTTDADKLRFVRACTDRICYGDPAYTYSDVEKALQAWMEEFAVLRLYRQRAEAGTRTAEIAMRDALLAKYPLTA